MRGIEVDLSPLGAHMLFSLAMHELSEQLVLPLEDVLGAEAGELVERLACAAGWAARFAILDRFILARVQTARPASPDVQWAWQRVQATGGLLPVGELARELGCSRRHLIWRFHEQVGPAPKTAARLVRFQRAIRLLERDDGGRFAEIAQRCGFYDQAHLNREFRELGGTTPGEFVARLLPDGFGVGADCDNPDGTVAHAELRYGDGLVMLGSWRGDDDHRRPGQGWAYVVVDDVEDHCRRAQQAGAEIVDGPQIQDYGSFYGARDPEGNLWSFGTYRPALE